MRKQMYVLNQRQEETCDAAGKAMRDVFALLAEYEGRVIWSVPKHCSKLLKLLDLPYLLCFLLLHVGKADAVFYSIPENHIKIRLLKQIQKWKHYELICFINDLNAFRYGAVKPAEMDEQARAELAVVDMADVVLIPNCGTAEFLETLGMKARLIPVGIWDYLMTREQKEALEQCRREGNAQAADRAQADGCTHIAFAGNLNKSAFLMSMDIPEGITMELWGKLDAEKQEKLREVQGERCRYHGVLSSDEIPQAVCTMDYGLVWDGEGKDEIAGGLGEYLRYNNSHKCALYLASGIPVIVWEKSGMAHFVETHGCGITIGRLSEIPQKLAQADGTELRAQARRVSAQLQDGQYFKQALEAALAL